MKCYYTAFLIFSCFYSSLFASNININYKIINKFSYKNIHGRYQNFYLDNNENIIILNQFHRSADFELYYLNSKLKLKWKKIYKDIFSKRSIDFSLFGKNKFLLQSLVENPKYNEGKNNLTEPYFFTKYLIINSKGNILKSSKIKNIGYILPKLNKQNYLYFIGDSIHPVDYFSPVLLDQFVSKYDLNGTLLKKYNMHSKMQNYLVMQISLRHIIPFNNMNYLIVHSRQLSNNNLKNISIGSDLPEKICVYILDLKRKDFYIKAEIEKEVENLYNKFKSNDYKTLSVNKKLIEHVFQFDKENIIFQFIKRRIVKTKSKRRMVMKSLAVVFYNLNTNKIKLLKQENELRDYLLFGVAKNLLYFWCPLNFNVMTLKLDEHK